MIFYDYRQPPHHNHAVLIYRGPDFCVRFCVAHHWNGIWYDCGGDKIKYEFVWAELPMTAAIKAFNEIECGIPFE